MLAKRPVLSDQLIAQEVQADDVSVVAGHDRALLLGGQKWIARPSRLACAVHPLLILPDGVLATLLFTDIVDSTVLAERHGDMTWSGLLEEHLAVSRRVLDRYRGREIVTTGDGILATFDGAERAVLAALALSPALAELGIRVRAGVHTGEIEVVPDNIRGVAVHVAARVMSLAQSGELLVSDVTRSLVESTGIRFREHSSRPSPHSPLRQPSR